MRTRIRRHLRSHVVAYVALFFALTGSAAAAGQALRVGDPAGGDLTGTYPNPEVDESKLSGVQGLERVEASSATNSNSGKQAQANCPAGKKLVGMGGSLSGGIATGTSPNEVGDVAVTHLFPGVNFALAVAREVNPTLDSWAVHVFAICAKAP